MTSYTGYMEGSPLFIADTQQPGLPSPMPISPSTNTNASATYAYSPTGLLSSETATTQTSPPSCAPPTPPAHPTPPSQQPCGTTSTTSFSWNTASSIPEMIGVNGYAYIYAGGLPTEQIGPNGSVLYYLQDRQGSTIALTDQQGNVVARYSYSPYGTLTCGPNTPPNTQPNQPPCHPTPPSPPAACPPPSQHSPVGPPPCLSKAIAANHFLYDGQYLDTISGLYYLRARWYDPATGQFTSIDALVAITGQPYAYAGGNPINEVDLSGFKTEGYCASVSLMVSLGNFTGALCLVKTTNGQSVGITATGGIGLGISSKIVQAVIELVSQNPLGFLKGFFSGSASIAANWTTSNATNVSQLQGKFHYSQTSVLFGVGGTYDSFSGPCGINGQMWGIALGKGAGYAEGNSWTSYEVFPQYSSAARWASDEINVLNVINPLSWFYGG